MALDVDLGVSTRRLIEQVSAGCSQYGTVCEVTLHGFPVLECSPFAIVRMSSAMELKSLQKALGDGACPGGVVVALLQKATQ